MYPEQTFDFKRSIPPEVPPPIAERIVTQDSKADWVEKVNVEVRRDLHIEENIPGADKDRVNAFYQHLTEALIETAEELYIPIPGTRIQPSWNLYRMEKRRGINQDRQGRVSADEYSVRISPQWIEETVELGEYAQHIESHLLIRHEMVHLWQLIHLEEMQQRVREGLERIRLQRPEIYLEVKQLLTSKEMAARIFEYRGLQQEEANTIRQFLYKSLTLLLLKQDIRQREKRRKQLGIDF